MGLMRFHISEGFSNVVSAAVCVIHQRSVWSVCGILVDLEEGTVSDWGLVSMYYVYVILLSSLRDFSF